MHPPLQHLAVPVAEENPHAPLGWQLPPIAPGRRAGQLLVGLLIEGADLDQTRIHPLVEQLDRLTLAGPLDPAEQDDHRKTRLLAQLVLRLQQCFAQRRYGGVERGLVDGMTNLGGLEHD
ncbi:hypothetical protein D3C86_1602990 [compost metagenome]